MFELSTHVILETARKRHLYSTKNKQTAWIYLIDSFWKFSCLKTPVFYGIY